MFAFILNYHKLKKKVSILIYFYQNQLINECARKKKTLKSHNYIKCNDAQKEFFEMQKNFYSRQFSNNISDNNIITYILR